MAAAAANKSEANTLYTKVLGEKRRETEHGVYNNRTVVRLVQFTDSPQLFVAISRQWYNSHTAQWCPEKKGHIFLPFVAWRVLTDPSTIKDIDALFSGAAQLSPSIVQGNKDEQHVTVRDGDNGVGPVGHTGGIPRAAAATTSSNAGDVSEVAVQRIDTGSNTVASSRPKFAAKKAKTECDADKPVCYKYLTPSSSSGFDSQAQH